MFLMVLVVMQEMSRASILLFVHLVKKQFNFERAIKKSNKGKL